MNRRDFVAFLRVRMRNRQDAVGDLSRALNSDPQAPSRGGRRVLEAYLRSRGAGDAQLSALDAAVEVWRVLR